MGGYNTSKMITQAKPAPYSFGFPMPAAAPKPAPYSFGFPMPAAAPKPAPTSNTKGGVAPKIPAPTPAIAPKPVTQIKVAPKPLPVYNSDPNANLREATFAGNENNTRALTSFNSTAENMTNNLNHNTAMQTNQNNMMNIGNKNQFQNALGANLSDQINRSTAQTNIKNSSSEDAYNKYNATQRGYLSQMGTADQDIHTRNRGQAYAGLDTGFSEAGDQLKANLAARGLSDSGIFARSMTDLSQNRMRAGAEAGVNAYTSAIDMSDARRGQRMQGEDSLYGANLGMIGDRYGTNMSQINSDFGNRNNFAGQKFETNQGAYNDAYQKNMAQLGSSYQNSLGVRGQALQNTLNNNQQRQANLMGLAQLGRGMAGMSQNYLSSAGSGYGQLGSMAGQTAIGLGGLSNNYNSAKWNANAEQQSGKGSMAGSLIGAGATMFSDMRLKKNIKQIGTVNGHKLVTWDWNEKGLEIAAGMPTVGVIAQQAQKIDPEAVSTHESGYLMVDYSKIFKGVYNGKLR